MTDTPSVGGKNAPSFRRQWWENLGRGKGEPPRSKRLGSSRHAPVQNPDWEVQDGSQCLSLLGELRWSQVFGLVLFRFHNISCGGAVYQNHNGNGGAEKSTVTHTSINRLRKIGVSRVDL